MCGDQEPKLDQLCASSPEAGVVHCKLAEWVEACLLPLEGWGSLCKTEAKSQAVVSLEAERAIRSVYDECDVFEGFAEGQMPTIRLQSLRPKTTMLQRSRRAMKMWSPSY